MDEEQEYSSQPYGVGDDKVHFDPIRAVQSIKLSNNYRTARSNDNFLSTVILNTYFFNNSVLHHHEIQQPPPKLPYEADISYISTDSNASSDASDSSLSDSDSNQSINSSSCHCSSSSSDAAPTPYDDMKMQQKRPSASTSETNLHSLHVNASEYNGNYQLNAQSMRYKFGKKFRKRKVNNNSLSDLQHALSTPNKAQTRKRSTISNIYYVPSKAKHRANPNKASQILGINSEAVIFANNSRKPKKFKHRKSNSFSETLRNANIKNVKENKADLEPAEDVDIDFVVMEDDEFAVKQLEFDKFEPYKRNSDTRQSRAQTVDLSDCLVVNTQNERKSNTLTTATTQFKHSQHAHYASSTMHGLNGVKAVKKRRNRTRMSRNGEPDVIEIRFKIDFTKKGYLFVGVMPAKKINNVVQPGFMFGFNEYSYALHGYCGKLYHDSLQSDYCFTPNNLSNKQQKHKQKQRRLDRANTVDITQGISGLHSVPNDDRKEQHNNNSKDVNVHGTNKKVPVLQSGDIVTLKMKLNRNNGKFVVVYCINNIDYGIAWKGIDPPVTIGVTMVGRKEQITLLSCSYKPYKNDKSCVIL